MRFKIIVPNLVIFFITGLFISLFLLNLFNYEFYTDSLFDIFICLVVPVLLAALSLFAFRLSEDGRLALANAFFAFVVAVYGAELFLTVTLKKSETIKGSKLGIIHDLRGEGIDAYPAMRALSLLAEDKNGEVVSDLKDGDAQLLPLGGLPDKTTVACNESGQWMIYKSDKYGFNNPPEAWDDRPLKIGMVGDSFTHGNCVKQYKNMAAVLSEKFGRVVNTGISGNGPLLELAALREYLAPLTPETVIWSFYEGNDITENMPFERKSRLLRSYVDDDSFSQGLMARNDEIADHLKQYLDKQMAEVIYRMNEIEPYKDFLQINSLRGRLGLGVVSIGVFEGGKDEDYKMLRAVLLKAKTLVESWGGRFYFVYLPESDRYFGGFSRNRIREKIHSRTLETVSELGIEAIDITKTFAAAPDARRFFYYPGSHYNDEGYKTAAHAIGEALAEKK
ncbi:MAG: hypothetical protein A3G18_13025 [Rhodospirillales bacterium RIFCSPLOWO2_12_FULL_58_28]|nr:MAG: hypothetical protein A3G18_13025 [Rhodospirillales bacterium RIFCSPLOWO2_12_FULL_58_28]